MSASEAIALGAVIVAGLSAVVTGVSVWINYRQSNRRLQFEREQAVRARAAEAFAEVVDIYATTHADTIVEMGSKRVDKEWLPKTRKQSLELMALSTLAWSRDMAQSALEASSDLTSFGTAGSVLVTAATISQAPAQIHETLSEAVGQEIVEEAAEENVAEKMAGMLAAAFELPDPQTAKDDFEAAQRRGVESLGAFGRAIRIVNPE